MKNIVWVLSMLSACGGDAVVPPAEPEAASVQRAEVAAVPEKPSTAPNILQGATGPVTITPYQHASFRIDSKAGSVLIDPNPMMMGDAEGVPVADLVLITDLHGDHFDAPMAQRLTAEGGTIVTAKAASEGLEAPVLMANGERRTVGAFQLEAVPMYNLVRGPEEGKVFHEKGRGNGYILTVDGLRIYISGDTECVEEMKALEDIDAAFVVMNLPYTMPVEEAAGCVNAFQPKVVFPYHHRGQDPEQFAQLLNGPEVRILSWYPANE